MKQGYKTVSLMALESTTVVISKMLGLSAQVRNLRATSSKSLYTLILHIDISRPVTVSVRVQGGSQPYNGRVEVMYNGEWGTICNSGWDLNDARAFCRQLGYVDVISTGLVSDFLYAGGTGRIWQKNVDCTGQETRFGACFFNETWGDTASCAHSMDVAVQCNR